MKLKCKQGDMALIIKSTNNFNTGRIVTCINFVGDISNKFNVTSGNYWEIDISLQYFQEMGDGSIRPTYHIPYIDDNRLLPLPPLKEDDTNVHSVDDALNTIVQIEKL